MGKDEIVMQVNGKYKELSNSQLYSLWKSARERLKSNDLNSSYSDLNSAVLDVISAIEIACVRKQFNIRRDELLEKNVKKELEKIDDKAIYNCAKICEPEEAEKFRRIRSLYRKFKKFGQKFGFKREYRWDYESAKIRYLNSRRHLLSCIHSYILHPNKTSGEFSACQNDEEIKIIRKNNRSRILRIKERMFKFIRRKSSLYKSVVECEENLKYQNIHQQMENEDLSLIKNVLLRICSHDHDFLECQNIKYVKEALKSFSTYSK